MKRKDLKPGMVVAIRHDKDANAKVYKAFVVDLDVYHELYQNIGGVKVGLKHAPAHLVDELKESMGGRSIRANPMKRKVAVAVVGCFRHRRGDVFFEENTYLKPKFVLAAHIRSTWEDYIKQVRADKPKRQAKRQELEDAKRIKQRLYALGIIGDRKAFYPNEHIKLTVEELRKLEPFLK